jgi:hypothetical protein
MHKHNTLRTLIAVVLLTLSTGTILVKSAHCALIPHDMQAKVQTSHTVVGEVSDNDCPICSFDFYPVVVAPLTVVPDATLIAYAESTPSLASVIVQRSSHIFLLRAPPAA